MRKIKKIHTAEYRPVGNLVTYSPLPSAELHSLDPFLFLNHHGPQFFAANNSGLPFGPHPHRGIETVTFIIEGELVHRDNSGHESTITTGGVQWMRAGKGIIHAEISSKEFQRQGGTIELLQLWLNLPSYHKMSEPDYLGLQADEIPTTTADNTRSMVQVLSGKLLNATGPFETKSGVELFVLHLKAMGKIEFVVPVNRRVFLYVVKGKLHVNDTQLQMWNLPEFENNDERIQLEAIDDSIVLFGHGKPTGERVVAHGPFVMNSEEEIFQAYEDYRNGKFGAENLK